MDPSTITQAPLDARAPAWRAAISARRLALAASLLFAWVNYLGTARWGYLPSALNGWKRPWYGALLAVVTVLALVSRAPRDTRVRLAGVWRAVAVAGAVLLGLAFFTAFPFHTWSQIPFRDDWPPRYQAALDGAALLGRGAVNGWNWFFLGGYPTSSNLSQSLALVAWLPTLVAGGPVGFHLLHALLLALVPLLLYWEFRLEGRRDVAWLAAGLGAVCSTAFFATVMPSGDTNSLAGVVSVAAALVASHAARRGYRAGFPLTVLALTVTIYSHAGFFVYAAAYLALDAVLCRDWRVARRSATAGVLAVLAALPVYLDLFLYPGFASANNVMFDPRASIGVVATLRKIYYNVEFLVQPWRWFNDYQSLGYLFLPLLLFAATSGPRQRGRFYACAALLTVALGWLNVPQAGYLFVRQLHMQAFFMPAVLAWVAIEHLGSRVLAVAFALLVALFVHATPVDPLAHVSSVREFNPALVARVASLDGNLVLLENNPHRNMDVTGGRTARSPFDVHFEALLPAATGKRFYGEEWDGFHWSRFRGQVVAGGTYAGRQLQATPVTDFVGELRRWGVSHLVVWSAPTIAYLRSSGRFHEAWSSSPWIDFELDAADSRSVVVSSGEGALRNLDALGADVDLRGVAAGDLVIARTNYYPAWSARDGAQAVALFAHDGQLAFRAPRPGSYTVRLVYPARRGLTVLSVLLLAGACVAGARRWL